MKYNKITFKVFAYWFRSDLKWVRRYLEIIENEAKHLAILYHSVIKFYDSLTIVKP